MWLLKKSGWAGNGWICNRHKASPLGKLSPKVTDEVSPLGKLSPKVTDEVYLKSLPHPALRATFPRGEGFMEMSHCCIEMVHYSIETIYYFIALL